MGTVFLLFLLIAGIYTGFRLRWFWVRQPLTCIGMLLRKEHGDGGSYSPGRALSVALAGTLGVGNITGVAAAIALGGSGALFWMWISAILTMLIKYAEVHFAIETRETVLRYDCSGSTVKKEYHGGPMRYMHAFQCGSVLSTVFCLLCIAASFVQGNFLQMAAAVSCTQSVFGSAMLPTTLLLSAASAFLIFGGRERISAFTSRMIPLMCGLYIFLCAVIIGRNAALLPFVFADVMKNAFSLQALGGGIGGVGICAAVRHGCAKGVFSHEAGCGTSPISHAGAETGSAIRQGLLGIAEVFVDTIILCTLTGIVLLISGFGYGAGGDYAADVIGTFGLWFGDAGRYLIGISIVFYAFSTLVCWSFYGTECVRYLYAGSGEGKVRRAQRCYRFLYLVCSGFGAILPGWLLWELSDLLTMGMTALNTTVLMVLLHRYTVRTPVHDRHTS